MDFRPNFGPGEDAENWQAAMEVQIKALDKNGTSNLAELSFAVLFEHFFQKNLGVLPRHDN